MTGTSDIPRSTVAATSIDHDTIRQVRSEPLPVGTKGLPLDGGGRLTIDAITKRGWNVLAGDLPLPLLTLSQSALSHNIETMAAYCRERGVLLAPHGKTTMAPQLFERQIAAGCWAMTAATPTHLSLYRTFGIGRILYANELVEPAALRWLASELNRDASFDFYSLVDSVAGVARMASVLDHEELRAPINVLIEIGHPGGRTGCRTASDVDAVASAVMRSSSLSLAGIEAFEGTLDGNVTSGASARGSGIPPVEALLERVAAAVRSLARRGLFDEERGVVVSAGGSAFFDVVVNTLSPLRDELSGLRLVLRSGSYVTHDGGYYARTSPLAHRAPAGSATLKEALELWSVVLSRPEAKVAILGAGKRDLPIDMDLPAPTRMWSARSGIRSLKPPTAEVTGVSDQHLHLRIDPATQLEVGDLCALTISHPCTAFDKWRIIPIVNDDLTIIDAIRTYF
jgi:D-serine dehydratase